MFLHVNSLCCEFDFFFKLDMLKQSHRVLQIPLQYNTCVYNVHWPVEHKYVYLYYGNFFHL